MIKIPTLTQEDALKLAHSKFENVICVGILSRVRNEAQKRADEFGGAWYSTVRIDGAEYHRDRILKT